MRAGAGARPYSLRITETRQYFGGPGEVCTRILLLARQRLSVELQAHGGFGRIRTLILVVKSHLFYC